MQSKYDLAFNLYNSLNQRLQQKEMQVQEQTPVFSVLQPVSVPFEKSQPKRFLIIAIFLFIGLTSGLVWSLVKDQEFFKRKREEIISKG